MRGLTVSPFVDLIKGLPGQNLMNNIEASIKKLCDFPYKCELSRNELLSQKGNRKVTIARVFYGGMDYEKYI